MKQRSGESDTERRPGRKVVSLDPHTAELRSFGRFALCPRCGYPLRALPKVGHCPECGLHYDSDRPLLFGWSIAKDSVRWRRLVAVLLVAATVLVTIVLLTFALPIQHVLLYMATIPVAGLAVHLIPPLVLRGSRAPDTILQLGPEALGITATPGSEPQRLPWSRFRAATVVRVARHLHHVCLMPDERPRPLGAVSTLVRANRAEAALLRELLRMRVRAGRES